MVRRVAGLPVLPRLDLAAQRRRTMSLWQRKMVSGVTRSRSAWRRAFGITASRVASSARSAQSSLGRRGCRRCRTASWWRRIRISAVFYASSRRDSRSHEAVRVIRRKTNRRQMSGDHHGRTPTRATLLVTATDEILGTHSTRRPSGTGEVSFQSRRNPANAVYTDGRDSRYRPRDYRSLVLWQVLTDAYVQLGFGVLKDEAFRTMALARMVKSTSNADTVRVLGELGGRPCAAVRIRFRSLKRCPENDYRGHRCHQGTRPGDHRPGPPGSGNREVGEVDHGVAGFDPLGGQVHLREVLDGHHPVACREPWQGEGRRHDPAGSDGDLVMAFVPGPSEHDQCRPGRCGRRRGHPAGDG